MSILPGQSIASCKMLNNWLHGKDGYALSCSLYMELKAASVDAT